jgi:hypothetical protein
MEALCEIEQTSAAKYIAASPDHLIILDVY